ncbi:hypothetical protein [Mesorhizobium huakuii]|uniref:Uncharacterized protein n=1 Tax=Mesorhizobium huakuii TaxID=28104 RepID=A0A7G6SL58_9HYPH|nr:hypothetical protein [Mesorhizobium huakuii]QND55240.1 hypothetical protein HB778_29190 [Mesorhizobium huakuii]
MKWGDQKRDFHPILAVWPEYRPLHNWWHMIEYAESEPHKPAWRDRRVPSPDGGVKVDIYRDQDTAVEAAATLNLRLSQALEERALEEELCCNLGDEADQAALCGFSSMTSIPSWNVAPAMSLGN